MGVLCYKCAVGGNVYLGTAAIFRAENYLVTREFERVATREQKLALLECLFAVTAADEEITGIEDTAVKQIATELKLSHGDYVNARSRFRKHLSVLKLGGVERP